MSMYVMWWFIVHKFTANCIVYSKLSLTNQWAITSCTVLYSLYFLSNQKLLPCQIIAHFSMGVKCIDTKNGTWLIIIMKGTEVPNPRLSNACDCTCMLTRIDHCLVTLMLAMCILFCSCLPGYAKFAHKFLTLFHRPSATYPVLPKQPPSNEL